MKLQSIDILLIKLLVSVKVRLSILLNIVAYVFLSPMVHLEQRSLCACIVRDTLN